MNPDTEQRLREWLTDRARPDVPDRLTQRVNALPRRHPVRRSSLDVVARPFGARPTGTRIASVAAAIVVIVAVTTAGILLSRHDGSPPDDPAVAARQDPTPAPSQALRGSPIPTVTASPRISAGLSTLQQAWRDLQRAKAAGLRAERSTELESRIRTQLDQLYKVGVPRTSTLWEFDEPTDVKAMTVGPDDGIYFIAPAKGGEGDSVWRLDKKRTKAFEIIRTGDSNAGGGREMAQPRLLAMTALDSPELLVVDDAGQLWRWRQHGDKAEGTLSFRRVGGDVRWGDDVRDIGTLVTNRRGDYILYLLDPDPGRILKYLPGLDDGSRFARPENYIVTENESVADYVRLFIDGNVYTLTPHNVVRHTGGRKDDWALDDPPDDRDLRPGHRYRLIDGTAPGRLFVYDEQWGRVLVFLKTDGSYLEQWATRSPRPSMEDVRGIDVTQRGSPQAPRTPVVTWATPSGIYRSTLTQADANLSPSHAPDASPGTDASGQ